MTPDCTRALEGLREALASGTDLDPATRAHLGSCAACRSRLAPALEALDEAGPAADAAALEVEARRRHRQRRLLRWGLTVGLAPVALAPLVLGGGAWLCGGEAAAVALMACVAAACGLGWALGRLPARIGLYKRLGKGRQVSGVCLGLAERTGTPAWAWRVGFLLVAWLGGAGLGLYLLLDLAMPVHPEDRPHLLRYRIARWWRGWRAA